MKQLINKLDLIYTNLQNKLQHCTQLLKISVKTVADKH